LSDNAGGKIQLIDNIFFRIFVTQYFYDNFPILAIPARINTFVSLILYVFAVTCFNKFKGIISRDFMGKKRPFDGFIGWIISRRYTRIGFIFNFKAVFIFKFLNLWGAHASGSLHVPVSRVLSGTWGTARAAQRGSASRGALLWGDVLRGNLLYLGIQIPQFAPKTFSNTKGKNNCSR
jgi:hypothetical protein